jgi:hypothetical protein
MVHFKGWTLVLMWITAGLTMWFFASIWPGLNGWLKEQQHLGGWVQAFGAILAIWGAYLFSERQAKAARALVREQQLVEAGRLMQSICKILGHTQYQLRMFREAWQHRGQVHQTVHECMRMKDAIEKIDLVKCNAPALVEYLLQIPQQLNDAIAHQAFVGNNYDKVLIAGRDEPGKRNTVFTREMNQTQAIENFIELAIEEARAEESSINEMRQGL